MQIASWRCSELFQHNRLFYLRLNIGLGLFGLFMILLWNNLIVTVFELNKLFFKIGQLLVDKIDAL